MPVRRLSRAVLLYLAVAIAQAVAVLAISGGAPSLAGLVLAAILFGCLYLGKPAAWWILLLMNSVGLFAWLSALLIDAVGHGGHILWANVLLLGATTIAMEAALLSPGMRRHVASRGLRLASRA